MFFFHAYEKNLFYYFKIFSQKIVDLVKLCVFKLEYILNLVLQRTFFLCKSKNKVFWREKLLKSTKLRKKIPNKIPKRFCQ